ncbi:MAG: aminoglycoside phosphotransferase family protein [Pseudonocardiales bacterium]
MEGRPALVKRPHPGAHHIDVRTWPEHLVLLAIGNRGIRAPSVLSGDGGDGAFVVERLPGRTVEDHWPRGTPLPPGTVEDLAALLAQVTSVPPSALPDLPAGRPTGDDAPGFFTLLVEHTTELLRGCPPEHEERLRAFGVDEAALQQVIDAGAHISPRLLGLCHGDLNRSNLLRHDGRTWVLDWELATLGDPAWDVAVLLHRSGLCPKDARLLRTQLAAVHPHPPTEESVVAYVRLEQFRSLLVDSVRYRARGLAAESAERRRLAERLTDKLREARPNATWSASEVAALLYD